MILDAEPARWLLVLHTALGVAAVAASTHLCVWLAKYLRGAHGRRRAVRNFAAIALALHASAFLVGNLAYPTYKTRVRAEYPQARLTLVGDGPRLPALETLIDRLGLGAAVELPGPSDDPGARLRAGSASGQAVDGGGRPRSGRAGC